MKMATITATVLMTAVLTAGVRAEEKMHVQPDVAAEIMPVEQDKPLVQMAILLDTSGSMSGLIDQARTELWAIVNEFIFARRNGRTPEVQVGLYEYGKSSLAKDDGYIRQIVPLTTDLDKVSAELFALKTNGGSEYCGWVIKDATEGLQWSENPGDLKVIFIAGNEPFTQGPIDYRDACKAAINKGIIVNTIHCRNEQQGIDGKWKHAATLADGRFLNIDHNRRVAHVDAPQDKKIAELNAKLNTTYLAYGRAGRRLKERQAVQDRNAGTVSPEAAIQRSVAKASSNYRNEAWDLVDAYKSDSFDLDEIKEEELPEEIRKLEPEQRDAYIKAKAKRRAEIQAQIQKLNLARKQYVADAMKKQAGKADTLGSAVIKAVREQAQEKNFKFEEPEQPEKSEDKASEPAADAGR